MRIADFTSFACTVTATVVEEGGEPERREPEGGTGSRDPVQQDSGSVAHLSPKCAGRQRGDCWLELANKPGCYKHNFTYFPTAKLKRSGACAGGVAVGKGTVSWRGGSGSLTETGGTMIRGRRHGKWVERFFLSGSLRYCVIRHYNHSALLSGKRLSGNRC